MTRTRTKIDILTLRKRQLVSMLTVFLVVVFTAYVYFVCASVMHVVVRMEYEQGMQVLQSEVNSLESEFIAAQHLVSERVATFDGYTGVSDKIFIDRSAPSLVLSR